MPRLPIFASSQVDIDVYSWGRPYYFGSLAGEGRLLWKLSVALKDSGRPVQGVREHCELAGGTAGIVGIDSFVHAGDYDRGISRIFSRRIDGVTIPRAVGQSLRDKQRPFGITQNAVKSRQIGIGAVLGGKDRGSGSSKPPGTLNGGVKGRST